MFSKTSVKSTLERLKYTEQPLHENIAKWESYAVPLASIHAPKDERLLMTMFTKSFGERVESLLRAVISALLTKKVLTGQKLSV